MLWWLWGEKRWRTERRRLSESYPYSNWSEDRQRELLICRIQTWPFPPDERLRDVIADLSRRSRVLIGDHGQLLHDFGCAGPHALSDLVFEPSILQLRPQWVELRLELRAPPAWPRLYCVEPPISKRLYPSFLHVMPKDWDAACAIYSPDADWSASAGDGPLKFLDLSMPWVFKAMVWLTTFQRTKQGLWLGPAMTGDPREDLSEVALADPCVCGSGRAFEGCCRPEVEQRARARKKELLAAAIDGVMSSSANLPSEG